MQKKLLLIGSGVALIIVLFVLVSAYYSNVTQPTAAGTGSSSPAIPPTFTGEDTLINIGITSDQVTNMEKSLEQYLSSDGQAPHMVGFSSLQKLSVNKNAPTPIWTVAFLVQLDDKNAYKAKMDYFGPSGIRLYLYGQNDPTLLYDSQNVGGSPDSL